MYKDRKKVKECVVKHNTRAALKVFISFPILACGLSPLAECYFSNVVAKLIY
jgi:hypothetical protein